MTKTDVNWSANMLYDVGQTPQGAYFSLIQTPACDYTETITYALIDPVTSAVYSPAIRDQLLDFDSANGSLTIYTEDLSLMNDYIVKVSGTTSQGSSAQAEYDLTVSHPCDRSSLLTPIISESSIVLEFFDTAFITIEALTT